MTFEDAIAIVLKFEGGYVDNPKDPGDETNFGISKKAYPGVDIANLTRDAAIAIYRRDYWLALSLDDAPQFLQLFLLDSAVNLGISRALKILQEALGLTIDGVWGPTTAGAVKNAQIGLLLSLSMLRQKFYTINKNWIYFGDGWSTRLVEVSVRSALLGLPAPVTQVAP